MIGRHIVTAPDNEVAEILSGNRRLFSGAAILKSDGFIIRDAKTNIPFTRKQRFEGSRFLRVAACSRINRFLIFGVRRSRGSRDIFSRAGAAVNRADLPELSQKIQIMIPPLALHIRSKRPADIGPFIPFQPKPIQIFDDRITKFRTAPRFIQVFNAQN